MILCTVSLFPSFPDAVDGRVLEVDVEDRVVVRGERECRGCGG